MIERQAPVWLACTGKDRFDSAAIAARVAKRQNRSLKRRKVDNRHLGHYRCNRCGFYHIGGEGKR